ncbi:IS110 family transposase [Streptomyces poonensis]|uniref:IS110 family transposase n=1 Tax=Streptomyces poonensis TaxID=68255 RepID=A0A918PC51_9ACTN|nr:IS110 family transposase [Streptomyces poonensis]GGY97658.1 IS110 family transposase [Streptomyces poonensis]
MGRDLTQRLLQQHEEIVDVPAKLSTRVRLLSHGHPRKTDPADARAVATAAVHTAGLHVPLEESGITSLRLLSDRRDELVRQRTQAVNRLHVLTAALAPGRCHGKLSPTAASRLLLECRPAGKADQTRLLLAEDLLAEIAAVSERIALINQQITRDVEAVGSTLTDLVGISHLTAAKILGRVIDVRRFATAAAFAAYCGTAPIEVSSGDRTRHRLSRAGDRQLNYAIQTMAVTQRRVHLPAQAYYERKRLEGKSRKEAMRCLKRRLADVIYRQLVRDCRNTCSSQAA